jgi:hypothetical protein
MTKIVVNTVRHHPTEFRLLIPLTAPDILAAPHGAASRVMARDFFRLVWGDEYTLLR